LLGHGALERVIVGVSVCADFPWSRISEAGE